MPDPLTPAELDLVLKGALDEVDRALAAAASDEARARIDNVIAPDESAGGLNAAQREDAARLLDDLDAAAARHGITPAILRGLVDLPGVCVDAIAARRHYAQATRTAAAGIE